MAETMRTVTRVAMGVALTIGAGILGAQTANAAPGYCAPATGSAGSSSPAECEWVILDDPGYSGPVVRGPNLGDPYFWDFWYEGIPTVFLPGDGTVRDMDGTIVGFDHPAP